MADYGPQTPQVQALIERAGRLAVGEIQGLANAWNKTATTARAVLAALAAAADAVTWAADAADAAWAAVQTPIEEAGTAVKDAWHTAWSAVWDIVLALVYRHLIGDVFTWDHYDTLTGPWRQTIGSIHPDDQELT